MAVASKILIQKVMDVTLVEFQDSRLLDGREIEGIAEELYRLVDKMDRKKLVLNFNKVQFLSSAAIGVIMNVHKKSAAIKGTLVLCGLRKDIMKIFEIMSLTKLLRFCADEKEAIAVFG